MIFSIIIPVFNEKKTIIKVLDTLNSVKFKEFQKEIIVVDDGSTDGTSQLLEENKNLYSSLHKNDHNQGKGAAISKGINFVPQLKLGINNNRAKRVFNL